MYNYINLLSLLLLLFFPFQSNASPSLPDRYVLKSHRRSTLPPPPQEYVDPTYPPLPSDPAPPSCSLPLLSHDFAYTYGSPPTSAPYSPPANCSGPWARVVLDLSVSSAGDQYDRVAAVWIGGVELLRTSTAEPTESGVFWRVRKDVTRYSSLLRRSDAGNFSIMLENIVNDEFTGIYSVNASLHFYPSELGLGLEENLADLILPISNEDPDTGFWFRIMSQSDVHRKSVEIPKNTFRAVLEIYVSFHSNDEFWYSNPPDSYIEKNKLTTQRGNAAYREVVATIDNQYAGSVVPFPVVFTGGINPLFWQPVVAIGAFNLPSYSVDVTPFLGLLLDGQSHEFGLSVIDGLSFWLVDANLHLWLDSGDSLVEAKMTQYRAPDATVQRNYNFHFLNGTFKIKAERVVKFSGWVSSSSGNLTVGVDHKLKYKNTIEFLEDGNYMKVDMKGKLKMGVKFRDGKNVVLSQANKFKFPLTYSVLTLQGENNTYKKSTNLSHTLDTEASSRVSHGRTDLKVLTDTQSADGWMQVQDHSVLSGSAGTRQTYQYNDNGNCMERKVSARDSLILFDFFGACRSPTS